MPTFETRDAGQALRCPECGSTDIRYNSVINAWWCKADLCSAVFLLAAVPGDRIAYKVIQDEGLSEAETEAEPVAEVCN